MIRPITLICFAAACSSGLYLYQEKHRVQVIDHQIEQTVRLTEQTRSQTRMLHAEWTLLNDPERLRKLAAQFLPQLQPVAPTQYTDMANLDSRLPAVPPLPPPAPPGPPDASPDGGVPVAQGTPTGPVETAAASAANATVVRTAVAAEPAKPAAQAAPQQVAAVPPHQHPPAPHPAVPHAAVAQLHPADTRADPHVRDTRYDPRVAERDRRLREARLEAARTQYRPEPRPVLHRPVIAEAGPPRFIRSATPPQPYGGSLLGMAQGRAAVPPPQPMPVSAYGSFRANGGN